MSYSTVIRFYTELKSSKRHWRLRDFSIFILIDCNKSFP